MNIVKALNKVGEYDRSPLSNNDKSEQQRMFNRIICVDGFSMSVQASRWHYCNPRRTLDNLTLYTHFEVGALSEEEPLLASYCESGSDSFKVFPYVPVSVINKVLKKHGGIKNE